MRLIERFGWKSYTILYEDNQGLVRLQELLKSPTQSDVKIVVRQLPADEDYRYTKLAFTIGNLSWTEPWLN